MGKVSINLTHLIAFPSFYHNAEEKKYTPPPPPDVGGGERLKIREPDVRKWLM
jgi:hypothetical protein